MKFSPRIPRTSVLGESPGSERLPDIPRLGMAGDARGKDPGRLRDVALVIAEIDIVVLVLVGEIEAEPDMGRPDEIGDIGGMVDHHVEGGGPVPRQEEGHGADADDAARCRDGADQLVGQIARRIHQGADIRMGDDHRPARRFRGFQRGAGAGMGEVDGQGEILHAPDDLPAEFAEPGIARLEAAIAHAVARIVGELHHAQAARLEQVEEIELVLDGVGALEMQHDGGLAGRLGGSDLGDRAGDPDLLLARSLDLEPFADDLHGRAEILDGARRRQHGVDPAGDDIRQTLAQVARLQHRCGGVEKDRIGRYHASPLSLAMEFISAPRHRQAASSGRCDPGRRRWPTGCSVAQISCRTEQRG